MKRFTGLLGFEFKNLLRDKMTLIMLLYPLLLIVIGAFIIPTLIDNYATDVAQQRTAAMVMVIIFANVAPFAGAAMLGFALLDHRDENTFDTIRVTPVSLSGYIFFKTVYSTLLSANASFWAIFGVRLLAGDGYTFAGENLLERFSIPNILLYAVVASLFTAVFAMMLAALAKNKIEGFAYMKSAGVVFLLPALLILDQLQDFKQYFIGIIPTFWPTKALFTSADLLEHDHNLTPALYLIIGTLYSLGLIAICYRWFKRSL